MGQLLSLLVTFAAIFLVIGVLWLIAWKLGVLKKSGAGGGGKEAEVDEGEDGTVPTPYRACDRLLSPAETLFHAALRAALPIVTSAMGKSGEPLVSCKVRLLDVLEVDPAKLNGMSRQTAQNKVIQRHADFVLCDPESTRPLLLIELDDKSHERTDRKDADAFLNRACAAAGLPILRVKAAAGYNPQVIAKQIGDAIRSNGR